MVIQALQRHRRVLQGIVVVGCLGYLGHYLRTRPDDLDLLRGVRPGVLASLLALNVLALWVYTLRYRIVLRQCGGASVPFGVLFKTVFVGRFLTLLAPQAGNVYRSVFLKTHHDVPYTAYVTTMVSYTWVETCLNLVFAMAVIAAVDPALALAGIPVLRLAGATLALVVLGPVLLARALGAGPVGDGRVAWLRAKLCEVVDTTVRQSRSIPYLFKLATTGVLSFAVSVGSLYACFAGLGYPARLSVMALFFIVLRLLTQVVVTPGNLGVRELAYGVLAQHLGVGMAQGAAVSVVMRVMATVVIVLGGALCGGMGLLRSSDEDV